MRNDKETISNVPVSSFSGIYVLHTFIQNEYIRYIKVGRIEACTSNKYAKNACNMQRFIGLIRLLISAKFIFLYSYGTFPLRVESVLIVLS